MSDTDLRRTNLNYFIVFEVLMRERHVGRAALRLGLTQSAVSHALCRLREALNDPLFVRHPKGVEPTPRATALAPRISHVLAEARAVLAPPGQFDASRPHDFVIGATDGAINAALIPLISRLRASSPAISVRVSATSRGAVTSAIDRMEIDMAITVSPAPFARLCRIPLFTMDFVGIARRGHPALENGPLTPAAFADLAHLVIAPQGHATDSIDDQLAALGFKRNVVVVEPHYLAAPLIVARTDLVAVVDRTLAQLFAEAHDLAIFDLPLTPPATSLDMLVSRARTEEPPLVWLQEQIRESTSAERRRASQS